MWWFKAKPESPRLLERVAELERENRERQVDLDGLFVQIRRISQRLAKRPGAEQNADGQTGTEGAEAAAPTFAPSAWSRLTPRQKQVQMEIMRRRGNGGV